MAHNGTLSGATTINVNGRLTSSGGEMIGPGVTNANAGFTTNALHLQQGRTLNNFGSSLVEGSIFNQGGLIILSGGSVLNNTNGSTIHFQDDASIRFSETTGQFNNDGTLLKTGGDLNSAVTAAFVNSGIVDVQDGWLVLGTLDGTQTGNFNVAGGRRLSIDGGGDFGPTSSLTGAGEVDFRGGIVSYSNSQTTDNITIDNTTLDGATLQLQNNENIDGLTLRNNGTLDHVINLDVNGPLDVRAGTMRGAGRTDANAAHTINGLLDIRTGHQFRSIGDGIVKPNKEVSIYSNGRWDIVAGSTVDFHGSNTISSPDETGYMLNNGTITKTGDGVTHIRAQFENDGLVHVQDASRWSLHQDANHGGVFELDAHSGLRLHDSEHTFLAGSQIRGPGELQLTQSSTAVIEGDLDVGLIVIDDDSTLDMRVDGTVGTLEMTDGSIAGSGELTISDGIRYFGNVTVNTDTTVGTNVEVSITGALNIPGFVDIKAITGQALGSLENDGTITKTGGGTSTIELKTNNQGTITITPGSGLQLPEDFEQGAGSLVVDGSVVFRKKANITKGKLTGSGTIESTGGESICIGCISNEVHKAIAGGGNSPGQLDIIGALEFGMNSQFEVEIAGTSQGISYDLVTVTDNVLLGGKLDVILLNNFIPALNDEFEVLTAGSITGQFEDYSFPELPGHLSFDVEYAAHSVSLVVQLRGDFDDNGQWTPADIDILADAAIAGSTDLIFDLDGDGQVTFVPSLSGVASDSDYLIRTLLGTQYGDANLDGQIDVLDLDQLGQGFQDAGMGWLFGDFDGSGGLTDVLDLDLLGQTFGFDDSASFSSFVTVPEPASIATFVIAFSFLVVRCRHRSSAAERQPGGPAALRKLFLYFTTLSVIATSAEADLVIDNNNRVSLEITSMPAPTNTLLTYSFTVRPIQPMTEISSVVASFSGTNFSQVNPIIGGTMFSTIFNDNNALFPFVGQHPSGQDDSQFEFNRTVENLTVVPGSASESSTHLSAAFTGFAPIVSSRTIAHIALPTTASGLLDLELAVRPLGGGVAELATFSSVPFGTSAVPEASALSVWLVITLAAVVGTYFRFRQRTGVHQ